MVHTIKSKATIEAEKNIRDKKLWDKVNQGIEYIRKTYPVALARSGRGRYALAYMVITYLEKKTFPPIEDVVETFNISETSYRRLVKLAKDIVSIKEPIPV